MDITTMRDCLHNYLDNANDKKVKAIYNLVEDEIKDTVIDYSEEFKAELDKRIEYCLNGGKMVTKAAMNKRLQAIRKKAK